MHSGFMTRLLSLTVAGAVPEWPVGLHRFPVSLADAAVVRAPERAGSVPIERPPSQAGEPLPSDFHLTWGSLLQDLRVVPQMIAHEGLNEIVAVIVALLHTQRELLSRLRRGRREFLGQQLLIRQKLIGRALIDQDVNRERFSCDQLAGIVLAPFFPVGAQI